MRDPLHTKLCDMLGIEFPIVAFTHCKDVVAAVCNAGGLGVLGETGHTPDEIAADIKWLRDRIGDRPFGVDLLIPASVPPSGTVGELAEEIPDEHRRFVQKIKEENNIPDPKPDSTRPRGMRALTQESARKQLDVVLDERVPVFASGLGNPAFVLEAAHARGMKVFGLVGKVRQARREIEAGVDVIVAQGTDAGGHTGPIGTFSLVPQVAAIAGETPVVAAGGVGTGRHLAAALCLGASGVWTGTIWLTCRESDTDMIVQEKILAATDDDTTISRCMSGKPIRQLKTKWTEAWEQPGAPTPLPMPLQGILVGRVLQAISDYKIEPFLGSPAGQVVGTITALKPARQIVLDMIDEARDVFDGLVGEVPQAVGD
jgi:NAD(P)H-dependent flavin oxidoreductase YrpB (nitropropane dioxygenase family)